MSLSLFTCSVGLGIALGLAIALLCRSCIASLWAIVLSVALLTIGSYLTSSSTCSSSESSITIGS